MKLLTSSLIFLTLFVSLASLSDKQKEYLESGCVKSLNIFVKFTIDINEDEAKTLIGIHAAANQKNPEEVQTDCLADIIVARIFFSLIILAIVAVIVAISIVLCCVLCISRG